MENNTEKVSEAIYSIAGGWFRYNYEKGRLEFIEQETKTVAFIREIPVDQWELLPSKSDYCKSIVDAENRRVQNVEKNISRIVKAFGIAAVICAFLFFAISFKEGYDLYDPYKSGWFLLSVGPSDFFCLLKYTAAAGGLFCLMMFIGSLIASNQTK